MRRHGLIYMTVSLLCCIEYYTLMATNCKFLHVFPPQVKTSNGRAEEKNGNFLINCVARAFIIGFCCQCHVAQKDINHLLQQTPTK